ncbi:methylated-DNA--[protein]-cysteine S-methyltransferase [Sphingomonas gilva]|uniref:Methylated-DNA--protein-cysteine methyltransferase n=1 Tax=Sphingomonas gilva TaxID=2305907 RepID=A0A396RNI9_9SPHN|nr:methylated-DNA--[protein]-cysteine S-methyltransferase [Sphingomonas gilva]RHW17929.1 methylated-DNA--[protein]-cysteine S-methyltransferase [Sphingomonas gilva]
MTQFTKTIASPVGPLKLVASDKGLVAIIWHDDRPGRVKLAELEEAPDHPVLLHAERELGEYFAGDRTSFSVPLDMVGTDFQKAVWNALLTIPFGETRSYGEIARQVGRPTAFRAVGAANGQNPLSIIAPCHRVIGGDGSLTGFGGGLPAKQYLLALEGHRDLFAA